MSLYSQLYDLYNTLDALGIDPEQLAIILARNDYDLMRDAVDKECFHPRSDWQFGGCFQYAGLTFVDASLLSEPKH